MDKEMLFREIFIMNIFYEKSFSVTQHITSEKHLKDVKRTNNWKIKFINKEFFS